MTDAQYDSAPWEVCKDLKYEYEDFGLERQLWDESESHLLL